MVRLNDIILFMLLDEQIKSTDIFIIRERLHSNWWKWSDFEFEQTYNCLKFYYN